MPEEIKESANLNVINIHINKLIPFRKKIFELYKGERYEDFKSSVEKYDIITPIIIRHISEEYKSKFSEEDKAKYPEAEYEIIAGHNRVSIARDIGKEYIPAIIKEYESDEQAELDVVMSNMQRSITDMPHSKRAKMLQEYHDKMFSDKKLEALKDRRKGIKKEEDKSGAQIEPRKRMNEKIGDDYKLDINQIKRYLRIARLNNTLLEKIDSGGIPFTAGVDIADLNPNEQNNIIIAIDKHSCKVTGYNAKNLKEAGKKSKKSNTTMSLNEIIKILKESAEPAETNVNNKMTFTSVIKDKYFKDSSTDDIEIEIAKSIELTRDKIPALISDYEAFENPTKEEMEKIIDTLKDLFQTKEAEKSTTVPESE